MGRHLDTKVPAAEQAGPGRVEAVTEIDIPSRGVSGQDLDTSEKMAKARMVRLTRRFCEQGRVQITRKRAAGQAEEIDDGALFFRMPDHEADPPMVDTRLLEPKQEGVISARFPVCGCRRSAELGDAGGDLMRPRCGPGVDWFEGDAHAE